MNRDEDKNLRGLSATAKPNAWVLLACGEVNLLVQVEDILSLMPLAAMAQPASPHACGSIEFEHQRTPVFCFNKSLQLHTAAPDTQNAIAILGSNAYRFALACSDICKQDEAPRFYPVPISMRSRKQPFTEIAIIGGVAAGASSTAELMRVLRLRGATFSVSVSDAREVNS